MSRSGDEGNRWYICSSTLIHLGRELLPQRLWHPKLNFVGVLSVEHPTDQLGRGRQTGPCPVLLILSASLFSLHDELTRHRYPI